MIRHIVLFNLKPDLETADRDSLFGQIQGLSKIPSVKRLALGKRLEPTDDAYKQKIWTDFGWAMTMDFEDEAGLYAYQKDPYHVTVGQEIRKRVSIIRITDFSS